MAEVLGENEVEALRIKNRVTGEESELKTGALFVAIGHKPNTGFLEGQLDTDDTGYIVPIEPPSTKTNIPGVFAVGDVSDNVYRQAVTAAGSGCMGALDAERYLAAEGIH